MRHGRRINHLSRKAPHRKAMLSNMASSLILHKRISTTVPKAKALRKFVEPLLTKAKTDSTHSRRTVFSYLQNKESVTVLFNEVADKIAARPGGYTRILKTGNRLGDNAEMCIIELVDYNDAMLKEEAPAKAKTRRSRRGGKGKANVEGTQEQAPQKAGAKTPETQKPEESTAKEAAPLTEEPQAEEPQAEAQAPEASEEKTEDTDKKSETGDSDEEKKPE